MSDKKKECDRKQQIEEIKNAEFYATPYGKLVKTNGELQEKINQAFALANNAIYFNDRSDYLSALWDVCKYLQPENEEIGEQYISEN